MFITIDVEIFIMKRLVGTQGTDNRIEHVKEGEILLVNIGSTSCGGTVMAVDKNRTKARI